MIKYFHEQKLSKKFKVYIVYVNLLFIYKFYLIISTYSEVNKVMFSVLPL